MRITSTHSTFGFIAILLLSQSANAETISFTGTFAEDDNVQLFNFSLATSASVTMKTYSYGGGTQSNGNIVAAGGFDPILSLFNSSAKLIAQNDDGSPPNVAKDPVTNSASDAFLKITLDPGNYSLGLTQLDNFANGPKFSDGFSREGEGSYTGFEFGPGSGSFFDFDGNQRTANWALDIDNVAEASVVPIPASLPLFMSALAVLGRFTLRNKTLAVETNAA